MGPTIGRHALVGAYERDNFGDLLFLLQTEAYLPESAQIIAAAPFANDMTSLLDRDVPAYGPILEKQEFDHIWTVGGEVGGADLNHAFRMVATDEQLQAWRSGDATTKAAMVREHIGSTPIDSPYMPRPAAYPLNVGASLTLNSVGFAGVHKLPADRQQIVIDVSREADRISVRDKQSSAWLTKHGLTHTLAPDLVHTIALTRPFTGQRDPSLALIQVSKPEIARQGIEVYAEAIARSKHLADFTLRFFIAGTAPGHDSAEIYQQLADAIRAIAPDRKLEISDRRRPFDLVDEIASASLWVGLSLHGRIISSAYGLPRVSFAKRKVDAYASTWDPEMPWAVSPDRLDDAVAEALSPERQAAASVGVDLARQAEANVRAAVDELALGDVDARIRRRLRSVEEWRRWLAEQRAADQAKIRRLAARLQQAQAVGGPEVASDLPFARDLARVGRRGLVGVERRARRLFRR